MRRAAQPTALERSLATSKVAPLTAADVAVGAAVLVAAGVLAFVLWGGGARDVANAGLDVAEKTGPYAVVQNTEGYYAALPLGEDALVTVASDLGTNVVEVADGQVRVSESDCANQVCVHAGWANAKGQTIVCLPHELTVQVVEDPEDAAPLI